MGCQGCFLGRRSWRALDAYSWDLRKVDKDNLFGIRVWKVMDETWGLASEWLCQLWRVVMRILVQRGQVHPLLVGETGEGVGSEEGSLPMGLVSPGKGSQCSPVVLL